MKRNTLSFVVVLFAFAVLLAPGRSWGESTPWDQSGVTVVATSFVEAVKKVEAELEADTEGADVVATRKRLALIGDVKRLREAAGALAADLENGQGYEETLPRYKTLQEIRETAARQGRMILDPESPSASIVAARKLLVELSAYYHDEPKFP
ncbi:MAG: hypothetical protein Q8R92_15445 [Deltaproteobacteria bacterium]|nr:hypothetical protein [Deltaproteobacteria bacterium]